MHLLVGKPALEALVRDIDVEAETHFMTVCKIVWRFAIEAFWSDTFQYRSPF